MTPQQANISQRLRDLTQELRRTPKPLAEIIPLLNAAADELDRRAPAPTEPAVDRDAVPAHLLEFVHAVATSFSGLNNQEQAYCYGCEADLDDHEDHKPDCIVLRAQSLLATPASPAVPGHSKFGSPELQEMIISHAAPQVAQASQPTSAEELQQDKRMPPVAAPVSQRDIIEAAALEAGVDGAWDSFKGEFRLYLGTKRMFLGDVWTPTPEQLKAGRCRAQGGITNHSNGLPTSAEGKDSDNQP